MLIIFLFLGTLVLIGGSTTTAIDNSQKCKAAKELDDICAFHIFQFVKPIIMYADQLQKEKLSKKCEINEQKIIEMYEKVQEMKLAEGKLKDDLISSRDSHFKDLEKCREDLISSKDSHFKDLEKCREDLISSKDSHFKDISKFRDDQKLVQDNYVKELQNTISLLKKNVELVNNEVVQLKLELKSCQLDLNTCRDELKIQNSTIVENSITISQLKADSKTMDQTLKESQGNLIQNQDNLTRQKEIIIEKEQEITKLKEQAKVHDKQYHGCGDSNGIYNITLPNNITFPRLCNSEIAGPGWIVIQQRIDGKEDFYRDWKTYKAGFGVFSGDFFLGLEKIHLLTKATPHELYIHMEKYNGTISYARYDNFTIAGEDDKYRLLSLGSFTGTADSDAMRDHEKKKFSTFDSDNDTSSENCSIQRHGGWWYYDCAISNLNGKYYGREVYDKNSNYWRNWKTLKTVKMLIRPRHNR